MMTNRGKRVSRLATAIWFYGLSTAAIYAQTATLKGKVSDANSGEALIAANVVLKPASAGRQPTGAASDQNGNFEIRRILPGKYTVVVSYIGYLKYQQANIELQAGENKTLNISLTPTSIAMDAISVTASRRPEKILEAPAAIQVVDAEQIEARSTLSPSEHLKSVSAVDIAQTGMSQSIAVVRGFNNVFSGSMLTLTDNRSARVPSLRFNAYNFIATPNDDIEKVEVVFGPGSALYGPNSANGVFHIITKSPFGSQGTRITLAGGERDVAMATFRHASTFNNKIGIKLTSQYYRGHDWEHFEPDFEPITIVRRVQTPQGPIAVTDTVDNSRNFNITKLAGEARLDWKLNDETTLIVNGGINIANDIELTGIGAAQAVDWTYSYAQARFMHKRLFIQGFVNMSDAGSSYLLNTGDMVIDNSKLWVGQIQHGIDLAGGRQRFIYGFDALLTRPRTDFTINGRNEDKDSIDEYGIYLQSDTDLSEKFTLVAAGRLDDHTWLEKPVFSPRAGLVFKPSPGNNFRLTYNRAFSTPTSMNLFLDLAVLQLDLPVSPTLEEQLGFVPRAEIRAQGVPATGFHFRRDPNGVMFRSPFASLDPRGLNPVDFISQNDPIFNNTMWSLTRDIVSSQFEQQVRDFIGDQVPENVLDELFKEFDDTILPGKISGVKNRLGLLKGKSGNDLEFAPFPGNPENIARLKPTITQSYEAGYKGVLGGKLMLNVNAYYTKVYDFIGPLSIETPNVFFNDSTLYASLLPTFQNNYDNSTNALLKSFLLALDDPDLGLGGNGNGTPADELAAIYASNASRIPFGTATPEEAYNPNAIIATFRNFGNVDYWGAELSFQYFLNHNWTFNGSYAYVSRDQFPKTEGQPRTIYLNAPQNKISLSVQFTKPEKGMFGEIRYRWIDSFPMQSVYQTAEIPSYSVVDFNLAYDIFPHTNLALSVSNLLNKKHRQVINAPEIGRLAILRLAYSF